MTVSLLVRAVQGEIGAYPLAAEPEGRPRRYLAGRECLVAGCGTVLSIYNGGNRCGVHQPRRDTRVRSRPAMQGELALEYRS